MKQYERLFLCFFCIFIFYSCKSVEISKVKDWDEVSYKKAQEYIQQSSLEYQKKNYLKAIELAQKSLKEHVTFEGYYLIGSSYYQRNDFEKALENLQKAEKLNPDSEQLLLMLGLIFYSKENYDLSIQKFEQLLKLRPDDPVYYYRLGLAYKQKRKYDKAIQYLEKASNQKFPYQENVWLNLADIYFELKDYEKSEYYYNQLEKQKPNLEEIKNSKSHVEIARYLDKGNLAFKNRDYKSAEEWYTKIVQLKPKEKIGYIQLGILYLEMQNFPASIENFSKALNIKKDFDTFSLLCRAYLEGNQFQDFERCIKEAFILYPENEILLNLEALYYKKIGSYKKALFNLNKASNIYPKSIITKKNLYVFFLETGELSKAKQQLDQLKEIDKENLNFWKEEEKKLESLHFLQKGKAFEKNHEYAMAKQAYLNALNLYKHPSIYLALGDLNLKIKNIKEAEMNYKKAKESEIFSFTVYEKLFDFYKKNQRWEDYNQLKKEIIQKSDQNLKMATLYGNFLIQNKEYKEALKFYLELQKKYKNHFTIQKQLAFVYYLLSVEANKNQKFNEALELLQKAISYDTANELYKNSLEVLKDNLANKNLLPTLEKAEKLFLEENYLEAKKEYTNLYSKWKKPLILVRLAEIEFYIGNEIQGKKLLESALKEKPKEIVILEALSTRLLELNQLEESEKGFKEVISINQEAYFSYYKLGIIELLRKNYQKSISYFEDSLFYSPDFLPAKIAKGIALYHLKEIDSAKSEFEEATKQKGLGQELAFLNLALIHFNQNQYVEAKKELKKLIQIFKDYPNAYYHLAYIEYEGQNFTEAEKLLLKAISLQKKDIYYWALIKVYEKQDIKQKELQKLCNEFLQLFPNSVYFEKVKEYYLRFKDSNRYLELSYPSTYLFNYNIIFFDQKALFYNHSEILSITKNSNQFNYHLKYKHILFVDVKHYLWIIGDRYIRINDFFTGKELSYYETDFLNCKVLQIQPFLILQQSKTNCDDTTSLVLYYKDKIIPISIQKIFVYNHNLYFWDKNKIVQIKIQESTQDLIYEDIFESSDEILNVIPKKSFLYLTLKNKIQVIQNGKVIKEILYFPKNQYEFFDDFLVELIFDTNRIILYNVKNNSTIKLYVDLLNQNLKHFIVIDSQTIVFVDKNKILQYWESTDGFKNIKKEELKDFKKFKNGILTFYY